MLRRLYLARNKLRNLPRLTSRAFSHLAILDVHTNELTNVENDAFSGLAALERLNLGKLQINFNLVKITFFGQNQLQHLQMKRLFEQNTRLRLLQLDANPWACDCR